VEHFAAIRVSEPEPHAVKHPASAPSRSGLVHAAAAAIIALTIAPVAAAPADPAGEWLVEKGHARIRIVNCDNALWGVVAWERRHDTDRNNPDPRLRSRPTLGMPVLLGMKPVERNRWEGQIYNAQDGRTYQANISLRNPNVLQVRGCVLGFLCGGEDWSRVDPQNNAAPAHAPRTTTGSGREAAQPPATPTRTPPAPEAICASIGAK
jgi:uncharacterized protein (DUF2147 family)